MGSVRHVGAEMDFRVQVISGSSVTVPVRYTGLVPDPFAPGRAVMVTVTDTRGAFIGQTNSLTTKCPSKYQTAAGATDPKYQTGAGATD